MKTILTIILLITFNFSAFAQIDTSAWEGKTVLVVMKPYSGMNYDKNIQQYFTDNWYLTDSISFLIDTLSKIELDNYREDTVIVIYNQEWFMFWADKNCSPSSECWVWSLIETIEFKNFQTDKWEQFIFLPNSTNNCVHFLQKAITNSKMPTDDFKYLKDKYEAKNNQFKENYKIPFFSAYKFDDIFVYYKIEENIFVYRAKYPHSNYVEFIDLKTNRVVERINVNPWYKKEILLGLNKTNFELNWNLDNNIQRLENEPNRTYLDSIKEEKFVIAAQNVWYRTFTNNCGSAMINCPTWKLGTRFFITNPYTEEIEEYIILKTDDYEAKMNEFISNISTLYRTESTKFEAIKHYRIIVQKFDIPDYDINKTLVNHFGTLDRLYYQEMFNFEREAKSKSIYVFYTGGDFIEFIDLRTNRIIGKLKLELKD